MFQRKLKNHIDSILKRGKSLLLIGPRQTGKTTLVKTLSSALYINLMQSDLRLRYERNPESLIYEVKALQQKPCPLICIDEIQKVPALMDNIQFLIDEGVAQFVLTGSSARKLKNLLPGRVVRLQMDTLSLEELPELKRDIQSILKYGLLPGIVNLDRDENKQQDLESYMHIYLDEEVRKEALVRNLPAFSQFLKLACIESGNFVSFRRIAQDIGVSHSTIAEYYNILKECMLVERFEAFSEHVSRRRLNQSPKLIIFDTGVRIAGASEIPSDQLLPKEFESFIGLELRKQIRVRLDLQGFEVRTWRSHNGPEVDWLLLKENQPYIPIEVKWTQTPAMKDAKHLQLFLDEYETVTQAVIICRCPTVMKLRDNIIALPWQELTQLFNILK